jgi:hypothetical protein
MCWLSHLIEAEHAARAIADAAMNCGSRAWKLNYNKSRYLTRSISTHTYDQIP